MNSQVEPAVGLRDTNRGFSPNNILVLQFGQLGDVLLSLPSLQALRARFPDARITGVTGMPPKEIVRQCRVFDEHIPVDRVKMRDGHKIRSILDIISLIRELRSKRYDLVVDIHSLPESNLLAYLCRCPKRLFRDRNTRSLMRLSNFDPPPPAFDPSEHLAESYFRSLAPLGVEVPEEIAFSTSEFPGRQFESEFRERHGLGKGNELAIGLNLGAGHPTRNWGLENFRALAEILKTRARVFVFWGPEEVREIEEMEPGFPEEVVTCPNLDLRELAAAFMALDLVVGNDTGPMHLAAMVNKKTVMLKCPIDSDPYAPLGKGCVMVGEEQLQDTAPKIVYSAIARLLGLVEADK